MSQNDWDAVDNYINERIVHSDAALASALEDSSASSLPPINVSAPHGKMLQILALATGARKILEIGTLGGFSTIWLARALPAGGRLITLEISPEHAAVARKNIERAQLSPVAEVRVGPALESLPRIEKEGLGPFDLVFIDADKTSNTEYFEWALKLSRPGTLIIVDNVVRGGKVVDATSADAMVQGVRRLYERISSESRVTATAIQTVGGKGYDGFVLAIVNR